jgi:hypothetical protein
LEAFCGIYIEPLALYFAGSFDCVGPAVVEAGQEKKE